MFMNNMNNMGMMNNTGMMNNMGLMNNMGMMNNNMNNMNNMGMNNMNNNMNNMNNMGMNNINNMGMNNMNNMGMINMGLMGQMYSGNMESLSQMGVNNPNNINMNQMNSPIIKNFVGPQTINNPLPSNSLGGKEQPKEVIPRLNKVFNADYSGGANNTFNIVMCASSGLIVTMKTPSNITIKQLIRNYLSRLGLGEGVLVNGIIFILNAEVIDVNDLRPVSSIFHNNSTVTVVDVMGVIAA